MTNDINISSQLLRHIKKKEAKHCTNQQFKKLFNDLGIHLNSLGKQECIFCLFVADVTVYLGLDKRIENNGMQ